MNQLFGPIVRILRGKDAGLVGAGIGFGLALLLVIFGILKTLFILALTVGGYVLAAKFISNKEQFHQLLDRIFPPGRFR